MSHIRSKNTKPEEKVRKFLFSEGFRYRKMLKHFRGVLTLCSQSIIAFYLSEYDIDAVKTPGFKNRTEAINTIFSKVGNGNNYLKLRRDEFDALPDSSSSKKGWRNRPPIKDVAEIAAYLHQFSFSELTDIVESLIENGSGPEDSIADSSANLLIDTMDEAELEHIINFSDPTAKLVSKTRTGTQPVYNQSIVTQLKKLYRGSCQICGCNPVSDFGVNICEAHHISFFSETQNNDASNIIILCPITGLPYLLGVTADEIQSYLETARRIYLRQKQITVDEQKSCAGSRSTRALRQIFRSGIMSL